MAKLFKWLVLILLVSALVAGGYFWLQGRESEDQGFKLVEVTRGSITEKAVAVGQIEPRLKYEVKSKIPGIVKRCAVEVGDRVRPGDALFEIAPDPTPTELVEAERRLESAESAYRRAQSEWNRVAQLVDQGIVAEEEPQAGGVRARRHRSRGCAGQSRPGQRGTNRRSWASPRVDRACSRRWHRSPAARRPGRSGRSSDIVPAGHGAGDHHRHG